jgi:hypothetical protein
LLPHFTPRGAAGALGIAYQLAIKDVEKISACCHGTRSCLGRERAALSVTDSSHESAVMKPNYQT